MNTKEKRPMRRRPARTNRWGDRGRAAIIAGAMVLFLVAVSLSQTIHLLESGRTVGPDPAVMLAFETLGALTDLIGRSLPTLSIELLLKVVVSLHLVTALFLLTLVWLGRSGASLALKISAVTLLLWGAATVSLLAWQQELVLAVGLGVAYGLPMLFGLIGSFASRRSGRRVQAT